ncbi:MAG TPA: SRPBCC family protein, partial [Elusimicrobiota bacterium]|nr:SRPBCC family protein [Elusimicrobiota bacterium]
WSAAQRDGPLYDVTLTFSGGREADGSPRKPLRFGFEADLERETVEPGGTDQIRSNAMHAFFDESRIPPEDRRAIAKDTEELVLAAQPDGSPLALDTVAKHFKATYGLAAMNRIAKAYDLSPLTKWTAHEPKIIDGTEAASSADVTAVIPDNDGAAAPGKTPPAPAAKAAPSPKVAGGDVSYQMENGNGREKIFTARVTSRASLSNMWEVVTGYDRLKQFVPDLMTSEREGQDGGAIIVHTVSLTRFLFFVFRVNLHLRILEHPQQHVIEFERIAGEFEQFRGSLELAAGEGGGPASMTFHATVVPKGRMPAWVLRSMAQRYLVPVLDAIRARAESIPQ